MSSGPDPTAAIERFSRLMSALMSRQSAPSLIDPSHHLDDLVDSRRYPAALVITLCGPDHPIGLELARNPKWVGPATLALSVSSTHDAFEHRAGELVERVITEIGQLDNLRVVVFDEATTRQLWDQVIVAATARAGVDAPTGPRFSACPGPTAGTTASSRPLPRFGRCASTIA